MQSPYTLKSTRLTFENFEGSFVTHGINVIQDPVQEDYVYIFAINHLPNPEYFEVAEHPSSEKIARGRSQMKQFNYVLHSKYINHVRSILHPLINTPNEIHVVSLHSFYVTNDNFYGDGAMRFVEGMWPFARWSNIVHIEITDLESADAAASLEAPVALTGLWNNNGLSQGRKPKELVISSAMGGQLHISQRQGNTTIYIEDTINFYTVTNNPSYYIDPYSTEEDDASGFVVAGVTRAFYAKSERHSNKLGSSQVWYTRPKKQKWTGCDKKLLFEDDGSRIHIASATILVLIKPTDGQKRALCFITGFMSESIIAVLVGL
ncbi:hypothetical protein N7495_004408 [Penicillium taxi]|uniref:uncharacterized protein n=1 Tax=Penicillium taxi TaxID=168475 RepID=UPI00254521B5|nr:uncharacterized protein N7495_004408 [Penicillium taxi]KAJ5899664.1 hypothetical protein N7495_004408 [Penicillium taxi]